MNSETIINNVIKPKNSITFELSDNMEAQISSGNRHLKSVRKLRLNDLPEYIEVKKAASKKRNAELKRHIDKIEQLLIDGYDSYADHLIIRTIKSSKVIVYARIINAYTAFNLGGYFCENHFNISNINKRNNRLIELSRIVIDPQYQNSLTIKALWSGVLKYANMEQVNAIMGTFPVSLKELSCEQAEMQIKQLKFNHLSSSGQRVQPYKQLPGLKTLSKQYKHDPYMADYFFELGPSLCGDAHWNTDLNQAELFFYYQLSANQQNITMDKMLDIELASKVA